ncbi:hypothetical protein E2C01_079074 [Portunus trituberculatus]|uniref:Uncharacterized protein n=1 Tax=Portunus trituberculatus TaxID=210409 RepID=A0A5B7ISB0_PORTR|nr:hypothetical protein [Portunus trituberculatus]
MLFSSKGKSGKAKSNSSWNLTQYVTYVITFGSEKIKQIKAATTSYLRYLQQTLLGFAKHKVTTIVIIFCLVSLTNEMEHYKNFSFCKIIM